MFDPAKVNFGPYRLLEQLGSGATSSVYRATRGDGSKALALKILTPEATRDDAWRRRFEREAFILRYWEEMDVAEAAKVMGCSEGSVKTHCSRATHTLADALRKLGITL